MPLNLRSLNLDSLKNAEFRNWLNRHNLAVGLSASAALIVLVIWMLWPTHRSYQDPIPTHTYFMDEVSRQVSVEPADSIPPLCNEHGAPTRVLAIFYTLGNDTDMKIAYLVKYTDSVRQQRLALLRPQTQPGANPAILPFSEGMLLRLPEDASPWVSFDSPEGRKIVADFEQVARRPGFRLVSPR